MIYYNFDICSERRDMENILRKLIVMVIEFLSFHCFGKNIFKGLYFINLNFSTSAKSNPNRISVTTIAWSIAHMTKNSRVSKLII